MVKLIGTLEQVQHDLAAINAIAAAYWAQQGYTVIDTPEGKAVVGKNAATGEDNLEALTTTWDNPHPVDLDLGHPAEGTEWYIASPTSDPRFKDWRDYVPDGESIQCEEIEMSFSFDYGAME